MKTVILCGGYGTRIREVAENLPKPMIPIGEYPILWHIMKYYSGFGHTDFVLCLGYKSEVIKNYFLNYGTIPADVTITLGAEVPPIPRKNTDENGWKITLAETGLNAMTGARLKRIQKHIGSDENFMLTYGDGVGDVDLDALMKFHLAHGKIATVTGVYPPGRFGELVYDEQSKKVKGFNEKPQVSGGRINGGFFIFRREIFDYLSDQEDLILERDPIQHLVTDGQMQVFEHDGFWQPMDTSREYNLLIDMYNENSAPWVIWK
ncbi:MAG: glucose-1-phosphate cytidylyltransferase [Bacteroidales bacterium]|nr:glucose-1-phosphate cytidylyltransferase [Bacteroidales bacterium]